jgi:HEAT repeat protein
MNRKNNHHEQKELVQIITDFLEMGHVENIVAMFKQDTSCYSLTGLLIQDERFMVRIGMAVLFEELKNIRPREIELAIPSLTPLLTSKTTYVRGEAATLLGIIGTKKALRATVALQDDPDPQVREIVADILTEST